MVLWDLAYKDLMVLVGASNCAAAYLAEEGAAQRLGCDIVPDIIRCVLDLVLQKCELEIGSDREMLDDVCRQLDDILESLKKVNCKVQ